MVVKKKRKKGLSVDMTGVEAGGFAVADGRYKAYPSECTEEEGSDSGEPYLHFKWKITGKAGGGKAGGSVFDNVSLQPQALWRLKSLLELWEIESDGVVELDPDDLVGEDKEIEIEITNEKYKGKDQPRITGFAALGASEEEEDDKPAKPKKPSKPAKEDDDDDDDKDDDDDDDDDDEKKPARGKKDAKLGKAPKLKVGARVSFVDEDDNTIKGTVTEIDGDTVKVEDKKGDEWELEADQLELL